MTGTFTRQIERIAICSGAAFVVTAVLFPRVGIARSLALGWVAGAAVAFATRGWV